MDVGVDHAREGGVRDAKFGYWSWRIDGLLHRVNGPAVIYDNGTEIWFLHGDRHRVDGPAYIDDDGYHAWYVQGRHITAEVLPWMAAQGIAWPLTPEQQMEFELRWG